MVRILIGAILIAPTNAFCQFPADRLSPPPITVSVSVTDTSSALRVIYPDRLTQKQPTAWFLNGQRVGYPLLDMLSPDLIQDIKMVNGVVQLNGILYNGQVYVTTKSSYAPKISSLTDLKRKYTSLGSEPTLFFIGNGYVNEPYDTYMIDENLLSSIVVNTVKNNKENVNLHVIKLVAKEEAKNEKPAKIRIRGVEVGMNR